MIKAILKRMRSGDEGLIDQPVFQDTERLRGEIVQAVAVAKAVAGAARPTTKGG